MAVTDSKALLAKIKSGNIGGVYYLYGADVVLTEAHTRQLIRKATGGNEDMALTRYEGKSLDMDELASAAEMFPMMSEFNCILISDYNAEKHRDDENKALVAVCEALGEETVLIISNTGFDVKDGKKTPTPKNKKLIDKIAKSGTVCEFPQRTFNELARWMAALSQKKGSPMDRYAADELISRCMGNTVQLMSELDKLCSFANGQPITREMVETLVAPSVETTVFNLTKAVVALRPQAALAELDRLYAMRTSRTFIVHAIASGFLDLYRASLAWRSGKTEQEMQKDFGYRFDFVVRNAFRDCRKIQPERLRDCMTVLRDLELKLNSSAADERILLEAAIVEMLEIASGRSSQ